MCFIMSGQHVDLDRYHIDIEGQPSAMLDVKCGRMGDIATADWRYDGNITSDDAVLAVTHFCSDKDG